MNLTVDIGNTAIKVAIFEASQLVFTQKDLTTDELQALQEKYPIKHTLVSKVGSSTKQFDHFQPLYLTHQTPLPIQLAYQTPHTLGVDRIAVACAAKEIYPDQACLIIDVGTCITFDYVSADHIFEGGLISPGPLMRFQAMHNFTNALPLISKVEETTVIGTSTQECMQSGVFHGITHEINGQIAYFLSKNPKGKILLTGGYAKSFESKIKASIFVDSNLVMKGLNRILRFNNEK